MEENTVANIDFLNNNLPDKCASLIIADPPYYKVKGDFDFIWKTREDYLKDVEKWAIECKRLLADNGTLLWYGDNKNIAYTQIILDKYFKLINNLRWKKSEGGLYGASGSDMIRSFPPCSETILMYSNEWDISSGNLIVNKACLKSRDYIRSEIIKAKGKIKLKEINIMLGVASNGGGVASSVLSNKKEENTFITKEHYIKIKDWLNGEYLRKEYEDLRKEYEDLRRPFNNMGFLDSFTLLQEFTNNNNYDHDTVKPETLTRALILTCSRKGGTLVVPFAGSGTECAMGVREGLKVYGYEISEKHAKMSNERIKKELCNPRLF